MNDSDKCAKVDGEKEQKAEDWLTSNKMKLNNKQKKKIKEWSKLKAFEIIKNKIFSPVNLEKKFSHIQGNVELMIKDSDYQLIKSVISLSNHIINIEFSPIEDNKSQILPLFQEQLREYALFLDKHPDRPKIPITPRCTKLKLIDEKVIKQILKENSGKQISLRKIKEAYCNKTNFHDISTSTIHKFMRKRMNLRFRKIKCTSIKRNQNRFVVINHLFCKKYIQHITMSKSIIFIDESSFFGFNPKLKSWQIKNDEDVVYHYGRFKSFCLVGAMDEENMIHYKLFQNTLKADDYIQFLEELINKINNKNKCLNPFQKKNYIFYMDNAKTHTCKKVLEFLENQEQEVIYAVPYTPELNAIELFFNEIKHAYHTNVFENRSVFIKIK